MTISLGYLILLVLAFCLVYALITLLIKQQPYRNIAYGVLLFVSLIIVLQALGVFGGHRVITVH